MKGQILKKLCSVSLSALMLAGAGAVNIVPAVSQGLPVSAAKVTADGNFEYEVNKYSGITITITKYKGSETDVVIPDTIDGKIVTRIGDDAFLECPGLTIKGKISSYAETYANDNNIPFKAVSFPVINKSSLSADTVILGKSITVNCAAKQGNTPYTYAVYYRKTGTTKWTTAQGYKTNSSVKSLQKPL